MPTLPEWEVPLWLVTHVDLHRTTKVQAFLQHIKEASKLECGRLLNGNRPDAVTRQELT